MKKIPFRHDHDGYFREGYQNIKELDYVYLAIEKFGGEELASTDGTIIYCPNINADILGVAFHEQLISLDNIPKYEKDKNLKDVFIKLKIDASKMAYLVLWTCFCAENLSRTKASETKYDKLNRAIEFINRLTEEGMPNACLMITSGRKGKGSAISINDLDSIKIIGDSLSKYLQSEAIVSANLKAAPSEGSTLDDEIEVTDKTKHRFFYEVIDWFIKQHREINGLSQPIAGINHDRIISRIAWIFGIANDNYKDGGLNGSWR